MTENVVDFPQPENPEDGFLIGPFEEFYVIFEGRKVPNLTGLRRDDGSYYLTVDGWFMAEFPSFDVTYQAVYLIANAMAIGAGYPCFSAETKDRPFAPKCGFIPPAEKATD